MFKPQVKVCGLTNVAEAVGCSLLGVNAVGFVFYSKSKRNVTKKKAREIVCNLPDNVRKVGVFVNESFTDIINTVKYCNLDAVQLHGYENNDLVNHLLKTKLIVIKALFLEKEPSLKKVVNYDASAYLVEHGKGKLPGGNALEWDWNKSKEFGAKHPFIIAGGLSPENIYEAIQKSLPDAVDVSSGVEFYPGRKDLDKVKKFIEIVSNCNIHGIKVKKIF